MSDKKLINQLDVNGKRHGYWVLYWSNGNFCYKGNFNHGKDIGYWEMYDEDGNLETIEYCL